MSSRWSGAELGQRCGDGSNTTLRTVATCEDSLRSGRTLSLPDSTPASGQSSQRGCARPLACAWAVMCGQGGRVCARVYACGVTVGDVELSVAHTTRARPFLPAYSLADLLVERLGCGFAHSAPSTGLRMPLAVGTP